LFNVDAADARGLPRTMEPENDGLAAGEAHDETWSLEGALDGAIVRDPQGLTYSLAPSVAATFRALRDALAARDGASPAPRLTISDSALAAAFELGRITAPHWSVVHNAPRVSVRSVPAAEVDTTPEPEATPEPEPEPEPEPTVAEVFATGEPDVVPRVDSTSFEERLADVMRLSWWRGVAPDALPRAIEAAKAHHHAPADVGERVVRATAYGRALQAQLEALEALARRTAPGSPNLLEAYEEFKATFPEGGAAADKALQFGETVWARAHQAPSRVVIKPGPSHRLTDLMPSQKWRVFIDETGAFSGPSGRLGRVAAVVLGERCSLKALARGWHSADRLDADLDAAMQALLSAQHVGVLGLTVQAADGALRDEWVATVLETLHWVLRLLPITAGQATHVAIQVEARGEYRSSAEWNVASHQMLRELHLRAPGRFENTRLEIEVLPKYRLHGLHPWSDLVAHTWSARSEATRARLAASELRGACLVDGNATEVKRAWDEFDASGRLAGETWRAALAEPSARVPQSVLSGLLARLGAACRDDAALWGRYLEACAQHLDGKAVDLARLAREVAWLEGHRPADAAPLPAPLDLAWTTARLEANNHAGEVDEADEARLERLASALYDEAPQLVCQADLDRAVRATHRFDFEEASRRLARWVGVAAAVPGLQWWGRVQSSFGQHAAFRGDFEEAELFFTEALGAFERLSDGAAGSLEATQTSAYRAIAAMDDPNADSDRVRDLVACLRPVDEASLEALGRDGAPASKYTHHVVLRWLVQHGRDDERRAYLRGRSKWAVGAGHPWFLIAAYRAILLQGAAGSRAEVERQWRAATAGALADAHGPLVRFIGLVLAHAAAVAGSDTGVDLATTEASLRMALPTAPWGALDAARAAGCDALALLRSTLPFNFR
jgi:hypothetical protein